MQKTYKVFALMQLEGKIGNVKKKLVGVKLHDRIVYKLE